MITVHLTLTCVRIMKSSVLDFLPVMLKPLPSPIKLEKSYAWYAQREGSSVRGQNSCSYSGIFLCRLQDNDINVFSRKVQGLGSHMKEALGLVVLLRVVCCGQSGDLLKPGEARPSKWAYNQMPKP